jgi:glycosyltransferase involved in cell wall biosynthesis
MKEMPLISVILPVYRVEQYLDRCLQSITDQTYRYLEIILVDDGSPDNSGAICDAWAAKDSRIRVIHKENAGAGAARNTGLDVATGEIVSMIDSDDYLEIHMFQHLMDQMTDDVDIAECDICWTEEDNLPMDDGSNVQIRVCDMEDAMRLHIRDEIFCQTPPNKLYRRNVIADIRFPEGNLIDDEYFTYKVIGNCRKLARSSACMYAYRQQSGSAMHKRFSLKRLQGLEAKQQRLEYLQGRMPSLVYEAKFDLFFTAMFFMQECLRHLKGDELDQARTYINGLLKQITPLEENPDASGKKNLILKLAQRNFEGVCKVLNFLIDIHVLS